MTAQIPEQLILDGRRLQMNCSPPLPVDHPRVVEVSGDRLERRSEEAPLTNSTGCWRGYVGTWEVRKDRLYLIELVGRYELTAGDPVAAEWFTGVLRIPRGDLLQYVHMGFESVYEEELHIRIDAGRVIGRQVFDGRHDFPGDDEDI